jgi:dTDP-4-amino-4,6-dideoxygalactose transaminase
MTEPVELPQDPEEIVSGTQLADGPCAGDEPLYVTSPALPPLADLIPVLEKIWHSRTLTNDGPYHEQFESALARHLGVEHLVLVSNATLGLLLALKQAGATGQVITTPFSFVGTTHAIRLAGLEPVFVDIDPESLNLDPSKLEAAITPTTTAILPVHCFGRRCNVDAIEAVARRNRLRVIYDAAHAFGVTDAGGSILRHGDMSVLSFHATKVFNTFEGGAVICSDAESKRGIEQLKNFGIVDELHVEAVGLNAKMNEFSAALGLLQLSHVGEYIAKRRRLVERYESLIEKIPGVRSLLPTVGQSDNHYNFPILVESEFPLARDALYDLLRSKGIYARRYFHPLISALPMYRELDSANATNLPVAHDISARILCLPLFPHLDERQQSRIISIIAGCVK